MIISPNIRIHKLTLALIGFVFALVVLSFVLGVIVINQGSNAGLFDRLFKLFNVDFERNVPTWFSSSSLFLVGLSYLVIAQYRWVLQKRFVIHWLFLGLFFLAFSMDEFVQLHEQSIRPLREFLNTDGFLYYPWILPAAILTIVVGLMYINFMRDLLWETKIIFVLAGILYVGGALGLEAIGGNYFDSVIRSQDVQYDLIYLSITHVEELLEMSATMLFLHVGIRYIQLMGNAKASLANEDDRED